MTSETEDKSLSALERETERTRADLIHTVDELHGRLSPAAIKDGVKAYARETGESFLQNLERRAREKPLQTVAVAAGLAYPLWRFLVNIPAPILLVGAGLALSQTGGSRRAEGFSRPRGEPRENGSGVAESLRGTVQDVSAKVTESIKAFGERAGSVTAQAQSAVASQVGALAEQASAVVGDAAHSARSAIAEGASTIRDTVSGVYESGAQSAAAQKEQVISTLKHSRDTLAETVEHHPLVVGGIGLLIGGAIAAALPVTRTESQAFGAASGGLKKRAVDLVSEGTRAATSAAQQVCEKSLVGVQEHGLGPDGVRETVRNVADKVKEVAQQAGDALDANKSRSP
jgi:Protein of unknown function (DUF3618)